MLVFHRVCATLSEGITRFHHLNLFVHAGETICMVGAGQSGKTHVLKMMMGLEMPSSGSVLFKHQNWSLLNMTRRARLRRSIGVIAPLRAARDVMQATARDVLALPLLIRNEPSKELELRVAFVLSQLELQKCADQKTVSLSANEQFRLSIGRAFIHQPDLVVADVPLSVFREEESRFFEWVNRLRVARTTLVCSEVSPMRYADRSFMLAGEQWLDE
jgi:ABC-type ATPase involved in cell division